jgi:triacylglycerol lipase
MQKAGWLKSVWKTAVVLVCLAMTASCLAEAVTDEGDDGLSAEQRSAVALANRVPLPIVLLHGAAGFDRIGPLDYYYGVKSRLRAEGFQVYATSVDPFQRIEVRAGQLATQISQILASSRAPRVHLIAHSQGGMDARYLISQLGFGNRVASLTTISTPHRGSRVADVALGLIPGPAVDAVAFLLDLLAGGGQDLEGQAYQLTERYAANEFDPNNPNDPRVSYYSVAGVTRAATVHVLTQDLCDPLLLAGYGVLAPTGANDGLVTVASARHGTFLGTVPADHFDEVGQLLGTTSVAFNHRNFYARLAHFLSEPGAPAPL